MAVISAASGVAGSVVHDVAYPVRIDGAFVCAGGPGQRDVAGDLPLGDQAVVHRAREPQVERTPLGNALRLALDEGGEAPEEPALAQRRQRGHLFGRYVHLDAPARRAEPWDKRGC